MYVRQAASSAACLQERQPISNIHADFPRFTSKIVEHSRYLLACLECEKRLPPRAKGGQREREYCSSQCRQRAYRKHKKQSQEIALLIEGAYALPTSDSQATRNHWRFERAGLLQQYKLLETQHNVDQAEIRVLEDKNAMLQDLLADKEAEIVRLTVLLDSQSKQKR